MKTDPKQKHEDECLERRFSDPRLRLVCTCGLTDFKVARYSASTDQFPAESSENDDS